MRFLTPEEVERNRRRREEEQQEQQGPSTSAQGVSLPRASLEIEHHPPAGHRPLERTRSEVDRRLKVQTLNFLHGAHEYHWHMSGADTATVVMQGRKAWLMFDVIHLITDRDDKFINKMRKMAETIGESASPRHRRHVFHVEPTCGAPGAGTVRDVIRARREEVRAVFRQHIDSIVYPNDSAMAISNHDFAGLGRLRLKLGDREISQMHPSQSRSALC